MFPHCGKINARRRGRLLFVGIVCFSVLVLRLPTPAWCALGKDSWINGSSRIGLPPKTLLGARSISWLTVATISGPIELTQGQDSPVDRTGGAGVGVTMPQLDSRMWTDTQQRQIRGVFIGMVDQSTVRIQQNGGPTDVPMANLSQADQDYVREVISRFDPRVHGRQWNMRAGRVIQGSFVQIKNSQIWILTSFEDRRQEIDTNLFSDRDIDFVVNLLDSRVTQPPAIRNERFRAWSGTQSSWAVIGRLKAFNGEQIVLEQEDQDVYINFNLLSANDQQYVIERFPEYNRRNDDRVREQRTGGSSSIEDEQSSSDAFFSQYYVIHPVFILLLVLAIMVLLAAVSYKYMRESFLPDDEL